MSSHLPRRCCQPQQKHRCNLGVVRRDSKWLLWLIHLSCSQEYTVINCWHLTKSIILYRFFYGSSLDLLGTFQQCIKQCDYHLGAYGLFCLTHFLVMCAVFLSCEKVPGFQIHACAILSLQFTGAGNEDFLAYRLMLFDNLRLEFALQFKWWQLRQNIGTSGHWAFLSNVCDFLTSSGQQVGLF